MKYKPNVKNLQASDEDEDEYGDEEEDQEESDIEDDEAEGMYDDDDDEEVDNKASKHIFKAAKMNPVLYEDKDTKKARRDELQQKKKMSKS